MFWTSKKNKSDIPEWLDKSPEAHRHAIENLKKTIVFIDNNWDELIQVAEKNIVKVNLPKVRGRAHSIACDFLKELRDVMYKETRGHNGSNDWNWGIILPNCFILALKQIQAIYGYSREWTDKLTYPIISIIQKEVAPMYPGLD